MSNLDEVVEAATDAMWDSVAKAYPEIKTGDVSVEDVMFLERALTEVIRNWVKNNTPPKKTVEVLLHTVEYSYTDDREMADDGMEHIAYCISQGIREGQLAKHAIGGDTIYGYWSIKWGKS